VTHPEDKPEILRGGMINETQWEDREKERKVKEKSALKIRRAKEKTPDKHSKG